MQQPAAARTLGVYPPPQNPYYNPYMEKEAAKLWYKQYKQAAKYGP